MFVGLLQKMLDPGGISNWSVTYVDWSERRWHPKTYRARDISLKFLKNITVIIMSQHHSFQYMTSCYVSQLFLFDIILSFVGFLQSDDVSVHVTSVGKVHCSFTAFKSTETVKCLLIYLLFLFVSLQRGEELRWPCTWNGIRRPCYLFARKFHSDSVNKLVRLFPNYTSTVV